MTLTFFFFFFSSLYLRFAILTVQLHPGGISLNESYRLPERTPRQGRLLSTKLI
mgnify:CR=1 FL=1